MRLTSGTRGEGRGTRESFLFSKVTLLLFSALVPLLSSLVPLSWADGPAAQHFQTGLAYERLGRLDEAYTELQLAFALSPDDAQVGMALGIVAFRLERSEVAQRALERAIAVDSNAIAAYFHLALIYEKNGSPDRALDAWHRFLALNQDETLQVIAKKHIQALETGNS